MSELTVTELATARSRIYSICSKLYRYGLKEELISTVMAIDELATSLLAPFDEEQAAANHLALFSFEVFPYEGVFVCSPEVPTQRLLSDLRRTYLASGYRAPDDTFGPDHIGCELEFLACLCDAEANAWKDELPFVAQQIRRTAIQFLQRHLLQWMFPFEQAVKQQADSFFSALTTLTVDLIYDQLTDLNPTLSVVSSELRELKEVDGKDLSLDQLCVHLLQTSRSGFYVSRQMMAELGRRHRLPRGFGSRKALFHNLFETAARFDRLPELLDDLSQIGEQWCIRYRAQTERFPAMANIADGWKRRIANTNQLLAAVRSDTETY